jgi:hypothetical protein
MQAVSHLTHRVAILSIAILVPAGCGGLQTQSLPVSPAATGASQIASELGRGGLIYVSGCSSNSIDAFSYPSGEPVAGPSGFLSCPQGMCADKAGDVWVANTGGRSLIEYRHGGTRPIKTLGDSGYPVDCSVDSRTGNLAVSNLFSASNKAGNVIVYAHASGRRTAYIVPSIAEPYFVAYDGEGNLFVDGQPVLFGSGSFVFAELRKSARAFKLVMLPRSIETNYPGDIQWDGTYLALGPAGTSAYTIYRLEVEQNKAIVKGAVQLTRVVGFFWIQGSKVTVVNDIGNDAGIWKYPAGGKPIKSFTTNVGENSGVTVSLGPR